MSETAQMPLQEVLQALSRTPVSQPQLRAALATTCARWHLVRNEEAEAIRYLGHALEMVPDLRPAMRLLYRIYLDRGDVRSAVMYLDQEIRATRHPREAAALYRERGLLVEAHFHDLAAAQQCYQAALKATPRDLAVLRAVERALLSRGDVFWLIANLETQLEIVEDEAVIASVLHDLALLETRHRGDLALAGDLLLGALERFPNHLILATDLFRVAEVAADPELMLHALEMEAEARPEVRRAMPLARMSVVLREHRERGAAARLLLASAHAQPHNVSLWRNLEELGLASANYPVALEACIGQLRAIGDEEDTPARAELYYRMGKLALFRLERPQEGLAAMRRAFKLSPGHPLVMEDTGRFLTAGSLWSQLLEFLNLEIAAARQIGLTREELALAHLRAGQVLEEHLGSLEEARKAYEDAIAVDPQYRPARDRLERILHQLGDMAALRHHYAQELEAAKSEPRRIFLLSVLGQLHSTDDDPAVAIAFLVKLLREQPDHFSSLQLLARLLSKGQRDRELLKVTEKEIELTATPGRRAKLLHRAGELALAAGQPDRARGFFVAALELVDDHLPSIESCSALLREQGDYEALIDLLRKELLYANDRSRQVALQLDIATILSTRLDRKSEALKELRGLLKRWPGHLPALHAAERLAWSQKDHRVLVKLLEQHISTVTGPRTRALLLHRSANVRAQQGDHEGAIRDLVRALDLWPQLGVARARLLQLYERLGRHRELQAFAEAGLTSERGSDDRRAMALQLAELSPQPVLAIQYLAAVAEARPEDYVTQLRLARACHQADRPSREAGALLRAASVFSLEAPPDDPGVLALRFLAARAHEAAGNVDAADLLYADILDLRPDDLLAQRGRLRTKERRRESALSRNAEQLEAAAQQTQIASERAAYLSVAAELHERRLDLPTALVRAEQAVQACPRYLPALHTLARIQERIGSEDQLLAAIRTYESLAAILQGPKHIARALCRAGSVALRLEGHKDAATLAWSGFGRALAASPRSEQAIAGLRRVLELHGAAAAPDLAGPLLACLKAHKEAGLLDAAMLRELVRLGVETEGPQCAVDLLESGMEVAPEHPELLADLAQAYARLGRWAEVVRPLSQALERELSPERRAALHYYVGEANERAEQFAEAVPHYLAAGKLGFHPKHSLSAAARLAAQIGATHAQVEALERIVEVTDGPERAKSLRTLAEIHRRELSQPDVAVELMRELLRLRPLDTDVLNELRRLLEALGRQEEALAALLAGIAHHRAWLRSSEGESNRAFAAAPIVGLARLFEALGEQDGVYLCACILDQLGPGLLASGGRPDELISDPWPLPRPHEGRPLDGIIGDLSASTALDLLREGVFFLSDLPLPSPIPFPLDPASSLPPSSAVVMVVRALAGALGTTQPLVFVDPTQEDQVIAHLGVSPSLIVGRRIASAPAGPGARDQIGRALLRLATGGDGLHRSASEQQLLGLVVALCLGAGVELETEREIDWDFVALVEGSLTGGDALEDLRDAAMVLRDAADALDPKAIRQSLRMAEDRAGVICAADPRGTLAEVFASASPARQRMLVGYLLSDDHLSLRKALGYQVDIAMMRRAIQEARA